MSTDLRHLYSRWPTPDSQEIRQSDLKTKVAAAMRGAQKQRSEASSVCHEELLPAGGVDNKQQHASNRRSLVRSRPPSSKKKRTEPAKKSRAMHTEGSVNGKPVLIEGLCKRLRDKDDKAFVGKMSKKVKSTFISARAMFVFIRETVSSLAHKKRVSHWALEALHLATECFLLHCFKRLNNEFKARTNAKKETRTAKKYEKLTLCAEEWNRIPEMAGFPHGRVTEKVRVTQITPAGKKVRRKETVERVGPDWDAYINAGRWRKRGRR